MSNFLPAYRQALAKRLKAFWSATSDDVVMTTTTMKVSAWPISSTVYSSRIYRDWMLMIPGAAAADKVRLIGDYAPTPAPAVFTVDNPWSGITVPRNVPFELHAHGFNPAVELLDFINLALQMVMVEQEFSVIPNSTAQAYRTNIGNAVPWLTNPAQVLAVGYLNNADNREIVDPYSRDRLVTWRPTADWAQSAGPVLIEHPGQSFDAASQRVYFRVKAPAYNVACFPTGGFGPPRQGFAAETDYSMVDVNWVTAWALAYAWDRSPEVLEQAAQQRRVTNLKGALEEARRYEQAYWGPAYERQPRPIRPLEQNVPGSRL